MAVLSAAWKVGYVDARKAGCWGIATAGLKVERLAVGWAATKVVWMALTSASMQAVCWAESKAATMAAMKAD